MRFRLLLLGPVRLLGAEGEDLPGIGAKAQAMLAHLAALPDRRARREELACLLWDGAEPRHALRQNLLVLRRRLGEATPLVRADPATVALAPEVETDLAEFEAHLAAGRLEPACALWRGPFCAGLESASDGFEDWLASERARLEESAAGALAQLARQAEAEGRIELATTAAQRLVALNALDDAAQATLIALYRRRGWTGAARLAHRRCVGLYRRELGVAPGAEVQAAARTPVAAEPIPLPPPATTRATGGRRWRAWAAAAVLLLTAGLAWEGQAPEAEAAPAAAWVDASEWRADARPDSGDVPLAEAIARGLAGDPEFAHLVPGGC